MADNSLLLLTIGAAVTLAAAALYILKADTVDQDDPEPVPDGPHPLTADNLLDNSPVGESDWFLFQLADGVRQYFESVWGVFFC